MGQSPQQVDSLLKAIDRENVDSNKLLLYNKIGNYYMYNNVGKAIEYFEKALDIEKGLNHPLSVANNYYSIGYCYLVKADFKKSLNHYLQSVRIYEQLKDSFRLSNALMSIGNVYSELKDYKKTDDYFDQAEVLIKGMKDSIQLMSLLNVRGTIFDELKQYDTALYYLQQSYQIAVQLKDKQSIANELTNIGLTYKHQQKTAEALRCFDDALRIFKSDNTPVEVYAAVYNNIAATHAQAGNFQKASAVFDTSILYSIQGGSPTIEMENYRNMSDMYGQMKDFEKQAVFMKKYYTIKDSLFTSDNKNQLTQLEADYILDKKNTEIVKKDAELTKQKSQRNIFIIVALATMVLLTALTFFYNRIKKTNFLLEQKNEQISEQKNELQTLNHVKDRLFSIISHDLRNPLVTLRSYLSLADNDSIAADKKQLFKVQTMSAVMHTSYMLDNLLAWANVQIKNTQATIVPVNISDCVQDAVSNVQAQAQQKQLVIYQDISATVALSDYDILSIALRNLLTNAIKFSPLNKSICITSVNTDGNVLVTVADEGIGLSAEQIQDILSKQNNSTTGTQGEKGSGLGLFLVMELLQKTNASLQVKSEPGKGSSFTIVLPAM
jgi:signal transduction histidine kinase/Tfp pilus assembly protein PilF